MKPSSYVSSFALMMASACGASPGSSGSSPEATGQALVALTAVPPGVACIQVVVAGSSTATETFPVAMNMPAPLSLGTLPLGEVSISGVAYNAPCSLIASVSPTWVASPQTVNLEPGVVTNVGMTFRPENPVTATTNFIGDVADVEASYEATYLIMSDGSVVSSGQNYGSGGPSFAPLSSFLWVAQLSAGDTSACFVQTSGLLSCWGYNWYGQLGNGTTTYSPSPWTINSITNATQVSVGSYHACAVAGGGVQCWGFNVSGQLGNGTTANSSVPVQVPGLGQAVLQVVAGSASTCALNNLGNVYCWGGNSTGALGNGSVTNSSTPVSTGLTGITALAAGGFHVCALRADGTVWCWGYNGNGACGNGTTSANIVRPTQVVSLPPALQIATTGGATCARTTAGVYCWGDDSSGQLGDGKGTGQANTPQLLAMGPVASLTGAKNGGATFYAVMQDQTIEAWGYNSYGQFGNHSFTEAFVPTPISVQ